MRINTSKKEHILLNLNAYIKHIEGTLVITRSQIFVLFEFKKLEVWCEIKPNATT